MTLRTVLHVVATLDHGGTEIACLAMMKEFERQGIFNRVVALSRGRGTLADALAQHAGEPLILDGSRLARARAFHAFVKAVKPGAVIFHLFNVEHVILGIAARFAGVKALLASAGNPVAAARGMALKVRIIVGLSALAGIRILSASRWVESSLRSVCRVPRDAVIVHYGCDVLGIHARAAVATAAPAGEAIIGMVARLDPIKDHVTLLEAFARLPDAIDGRQLRLVLAGDGPLRTDLHAKAAELGIASRTTFSGTLSTVPEALACFEAFVFSTTRAEGFGIAMLEALAAGVPVIASDVPACREVLQDGKLGRLVPAGSPQALATALEDVLRTPPRVPPVSDIAELYGADVMARGYLEALGQAPRR